MSSADTRRDRIAGKSRHLRPRPLSTAFLGQTTLVLCAIACCPGAAANLDLLGVGVRGRVGEKKVLGQEAPESFRAYDFVASFQLPWQRVSSSDWGVGTRLITSAGVLQGAGKTELVMSAIPVLAFGSRDGRFTLDFGAGLALISEHRYAQQDFGGPLQGALTFGVGIPLYRQLGVGYRFQHYSDAGAYGSGTIGVDFHMLEFSYRF